MKHNEERAELLRRWVSSGENLSACEAVVSASRSSKTIGAKIRRLVPVKDMSAPPYSFSQ